MRTAISIVGVLALCVCALVLSASRASATTIDTFDDDFNDLTVSSAVHDQFDCQTGLANVLGGTRKIHLQWLAGDVGPEAAAAITSSVGGMYLDYSNPADGVIGGAWDTALTLLYDGDPTPLTNDGTENGHFNLSNSSVLYILADGADIATTAHWTLTDQDSSDTVDVPIGAIPFLTPTLLLTPLGSFNGIDFTDLKSIQLTIDGPNAGDYRFDEIGHRDGFGQIPEPLTILGLFLGVGSVGAYIRKRRMA